METVYAFCRTTDDIVDDERDEERKVILLRSWRMELGKALDGTSAAPLLNQLAATARRFRIPVDHFYELIRGVEMDLTKKRYQTYEELERYCYLVAGSVGLMCREIFGYKNDSTREYALNLATALQLTNILRDVGDDARRGRIYLPLEDLHRFGYTEDDLLHCRHTPEFVKLMQFEIDRARGYFAAAQASLKDEDKGFFFPARIMWSVYAHLLNRIERTNFDVFTRRISISTPLKVLIAARYWLSHQLKYS